MPTPLDATRLAGCHVLVVDDNQDAADSLSLMLQFLGAQVSVAYDGQTAIDLVRTSRPDIVLLDLGMPGMDGYETVDHMRRAEPPGQRTQIVALTGWARPEDRARTREAGFDQHLLKPVDIDTLVATLDWCGPPRPGDREGGTAGRLNLP